MSSIRLYGSEHFIKEHGDRINAVYKALEGLTLAQAKSVLELVDELLPSAVTLASGKSLCAKPSESPE